MAPIKCPECNQDVSPAAAACPGCGHPLQERATGSSTPTSVPSTPAVKSSGGAGKAFVLIVAVIGLVAMCNVLGRQSSTSTSSSSSYEQYQTSSDPATVLTRRCAAEAGIPSNDPKHKITPDEMRRLTACVDRNR